MSSSTPTSSPPLVSVVVSSYNYAGYVGRAIESVQAQTLRNWECIVVDDGSTDDTRAVVGRYAEQDRRVRYVRQENQGPSAARNNGIRQSAGRYIQLLDADDFIEPEKLALQVDYLERHPGADIVYGDHLYFTDGDGGLVYLNSEEHKVWQPAETPSGVGAEVLRPLMRMNILAVHAALVRRRDGAEPVLFDLELRGPEDWFYWVCNAAAGRRFEYSPLPGTLGLVRSHPHSLSSNTRRMLIQMLSVRRKIRGLVEDPEILALNEHFAGQEESWLLYELRQVGPARAAYDLGRVVLRTRSAKWLGRAVTVPLAGLGRRLAAAVRARAAAARAAAGHGRRGGRGPGREEEPGRAALRAGAPAEGGEDADRR